MISKPSIDDPENFGDRRLVDKHISHRATDPAVTLTIHANSVSTCPDKPSLTPIRRQYGGGQRAKIHGYTPASQRRQRRAFARIRPLFSLNDPILFTAVTLPDDVADEPTTAKRWHQRLFQRMQRKFGFQIGEHWRQHMVPRQTGAKIGEIVPHYHSFLFNVFPNQHIDANRPFHETTLYRHFLSDPKFCNIAQEYEERYERRYNRKSPLKWRKNLIDAFRIWLAWNWFEIVGSEDERHLFVGTRAEIRSTREEVRTARQYLERDNSDHNELGRQETPGLQMDKSPEGVDLAPQDEPLPNTGRVWGERGQIDRSPSIVKRLTMQQYTSLRRMIVGYLRSKGGTARVYARWITRQTSREWLNGIPSGFTVLGLGDLSDPIWTQIEKSTIFRMLKHVLTMDRAR